MSPIKMIALIILVVAVVSGCGGYGFGKPDISIKGTIVFVSTGEIQQGGLHEIFLLDAKGTRRLANDAFYNAGPVLSPDGTQIAYINKGLQLVIVKCDGSGGAYLTPEVSDISLYPEDPAWLPDGNISILVDDKIAVLSTDGSGVRVLTPPNINSSYDWSPDGTQIVYDCGSAVCVLNVESGESRTVIEAPRESEPPRHFSAFDWSHDGTKILAGKGEASWHYSDDLEPEDLYVFNANGSGLHALLQPGSESNPAWSPDGEKIIYDSWTENSNYEDGRSHDLWVMNADGSGAQKLLSRANRWTYSPDWAAP